MPHTPSPLRYPGGKHSIKGMVSMVIKDNDLAQGIYAEPYAGGCGLALSMLFDGYMHELCLNDIDRSVYAFWNTVLYAHQDLIELIECTDVTMDEWYAQRKIQDKKDTADLVQLAYSTLFLNRTNRSGIIIKAGVIGGKEQAGKYKLDCRFNKTTMINKIKRVAKYAHRIEFTNLDAIEFMQHTDQRYGGKAFFCIDPPYFEKGSALYTNCYEPEGHQIVAETILGLESPWILTYDNKPQIRELYASKEQRCFYLNYSAARKRIATELLVKSDKIKFAKKLPLLKAA